ncbi:TPA: insulinase family protein, partial [Candidatus Poribacteria bacterium]|nr:insulinase family protein [Candidatus Poribacteria bacterium]
EQHFGEANPEKRKEIYAQINAESQLAAQYAVPNELDKLYESMGASFKNAGTGQELTVYQVNLPSNRLQQWAKIESHRLFGKPVFRLFHTELETVYDEKNLALDNKGRLIRDAVYELVYKKHPYGRSTIGTVEHLKKPSLVKIYDFFDTYYVPNNMAICISGDIEIEKTIQIIADNFKNLEPRLLPDPERWEEDPIDGIERVTVQYQGEEYVMIVFQTAPQNHADMEALMLFDMILDNATAGLINLNLNQQQKVRQAGSRPTLSNDYGSQELWGIPKKDQSLEEVEQLLLEQVNLIKQGQFEDWIIPAIVTDFKKSQKAGLENNESRVGALRSSFITNQNWSHAIRSIARMGKLAKENVVAVANKYFGDNYVVGYRIDAQHELPQIEKPQIDPIEMDPTRQSAFAVSVMAMPVTEIEPVFIKTERDYQIVDYYPGVKLYHSENPVNDLFTLTFSFEVGKLHHQKLG